MKTLQTIALTTLFAVSSAASLVACKGEGCGRIDVLACMSTAELEKLITPPCRGIPI